MAYDSTNLSALSYANGFTLWHYRTKDSWIDLSVAGYFNDAASMLRVGDMIMVNSDLEASHGGRHGTMVVLRYQVGGDVDARYLSDPIGITMHG